MSDREQIDHAFGHPSFVGSEHPLAAERGVPRSGPDRYAVDVVYPDGNPATVSRHDTLRQALDAAEREREAHLRDGFLRSQFFVGVHDTDDGERGWLTEDDDEGGDG